jgi:uncharacterized pyridoxal phosphate-containing UPF0001 family protein
VSREAKYQQIVDTANAAAKIVGRVQLNKRVLLTVSLEEHHAVQLVALARHLDRPVAEIVVEAVQRHLETGGGAP